MNDDNDKRYDLYIKGNRIAFVEIGFVEDRLSMVIDTLVDREWLIKEGIEYDPYLYKSYMKEEYEDCFFYSAGSTLELVNRILKKNKITIDDTNLEKLCKNHVCEVQNHVIGIVRSAKNGDSITFNGNKLDSIVMDEVMKNRILEILNM